MYSERIKYKNSLRTRYRCKKNEDKKNQQQIELILCDCVRVCSRRAPLMGRSNIFKLVYLNNSSSLLLLLLLFVYLFAGWLAGWLASMQCSVKAKCEVILSLFSPCFFCCRRRSMCTMYILYYTYGSLLFVRLLLFVPADVSQGFPIIFVSCFVFHSGLNRVVYVQQTTNSTYYFFCLYFPVSLSYRFLFVGRRFSSL